MTDSRDHQHPMTSSPNFTSNVAAFRESHWTHLLFMLLRSTVWPVIDSCSVGRCMSTEGVNVICSKPCKWSLGSSSRIARSLIEIHHEGFVPLLSSQGPSQGPLKAPLKARAEFGRETKLICMHALYASALLLAVREAIRTLPPCPPMAIDSAPRLLQPSPG